MTSPVRPLRSRLLLPETLPFTDPKERRWWYNYRGAGVRTYAFDDFNRADSATTLGSAWTASGLTFGIDGKMAYAPEVAVASASGIAYRDLGAADVDLTCGVVLSAGANKSRGGLYLRGDGTTANGWFVFMDSLGTTTLRLIKIVSSTATDVDTASFTPTANTLYALRVRAVGSAWEVFVNGTSMLTGTDAANATLTNFGLWGSLKSGGGAVHYSTFSARIP